MISNKIAKLMLFICFLHSTAKVQATVLVIPSPGSNSTAYLNSCQREGYVCMSDYLSEFFQTQETPLYNSIISELDLEQDEFLQELNGRIKTVLESEMLSIEQVDSFVSILERATDIQPKNKSFKVLRSELSQLKDFVSRAEATPESRYFIFKKNVPELPNTILKTISFQPLTQEFSADGIVNSGKLTPFQVGECMEAKVNPVLHSYFKNAQYVFFKNESCGGNSGLSEIFASSDQHRLYFDPMKKSEPGFFSRNKTALIWMGAMIGVGALASQYEIKIEY